MQTQLHKKTQKYEHKKEENQTSNTNQKKQFKDQNTLFTGIFPGIMQTQLHKKNQKYENIGGLSIRGRWRQRVPVKYEIMNYTVL